MNARFFQQPAVFLALVVLVNLAACSPAASATAGSCWPTLHHDYQRSGYTDEVVRGPVEQKWFRHFAEEMIGPRVEAIVAEGLCFVGTYAGNLYALDVTDGKTVWQHRAPGPIGHSPCYRDGKVYVGCDDAFNCGTLACLRAGDGEVLWIYRAAAGIFNSPACDGRRVYVGDRAGVFHAVEAQGGRVAWTFPTGAMILKPASFSPDGQRVLVGSEDMHVYCLSPEGELLWKSAKLPGLSLRDQAPTVWADKVIVRTNPAMPFHESLYVNRSLLGGIQRDIPLDDNEDKVVVNTPNMLFLRRTQRREQAEHQGVVEYLEENPHARTWHTLNLSDGRQPWITSVMFTSGMHNPPSPPTFNPKTGELFTIVPTALSVYCSGVSQVGIGIGRIDSQTGYLANIAHAEGDREPGYFAGMPMITDETSTLSLMGDFLVVTHMGAVGGVDLKTRKIRQLAGVRDSYGGIFGPGVHGGWDGSRKLALEGFVENTVNEWHGPDRSCVSIAEGRMFWVVGGQVVCLGGPEIPATESGGAKAPEPFRWTHMPRINGGNVMGPLGSYDANVKKRVLTAADVKPYVECPADDKPFGGDEEEALPEKLAAEMRRRLDAAVVELIDGHPWALLVVELGISHEEQHFWRASETMQAVAMALPHLSPEVRARAVAYLDELFAEGVPLTRSIIGGEGRRREPFDLAPGMLKGNAVRPPKQPPEVADLYAVWAYAHYADRWDRVLAEPATILDGFRRAFSEPVAFDPDAGGGNAVEELNRQIAGVIGYIRIAERAGAADDVKMATNRLADLTTARVHFEIADPRLQGKREHHGTFPRYQQLVPELARMLTDHAGQPLRANLSDLRRELPLWHQAWGERLIGGENYISPPGLARGMFPALAYGLRAKPEELARYLDQPWCRADLYYIEKLTAALRSMEAAQ
ncbi:MAG: PQQ-binding-like beta-propeller repeat protein [Pirellulales bacterium]|nr:PQQ-binding-like beta-propeller repeat protein [Pirellulales bacterium]